MEDILDSVFIALAVAMLLAGVGLAVACMRLQRRGGRS
jgi:hypothetical protein